VDERQAVYIVTVGRRAQIAKFDDRSRTGRATLQNYVWVEQVLPWKLTWGNTRAAVLRITWKSRGRM